MYRVVNYNTDGGLVVSAWVICPDDYCATPFLFQYVFYGYSKSYAIKLYNNIMKERNYKYDRN
jgi:hypothetical protein